MHYPRTTAHEVLGERQVLDKAISRIAGLLSAGWWQRGRRTPALTSTVLQLRNWGGECGAKVSVGRALAIC